MILDKIKLKEARHLLTYDCPLACLHCYMSAGEHSEVKPLKFSQEQADKFYGFFKPEVVSATGGEPLMQYDLVKILARATEKYNGALELVTNGLLLNADKVKELNSLNKNLFYQISLDGTREYHDKLRQRKGAYDSAINAIDLASSSGRLTKVRMTVTPENQSQIEEVAKFLDSYKRDNIRLVMRPIIASGRAKVNNLGFGPEFSGKLDSFDYNLNHVKIETTDNLGKCGCGIDTIALDPKGDIYPCCYMVFTPKFKIGNLLDDFENLRQHEEFVNFKGTCYARHSGMQK